MRRLFYRNVNARDHLEIFLVSAVSALLINRFFLYLTNYPSVGGSKYHIAPMLYGGLLMLVSITLALTFLGERVQKLSSLVGGVGFGIFIDELGKFITRDNNYFFRPTIGLIYAIFIIMFLVFNSLSSLNRLTQREYELNALAQLQEAVLQDLDRTEKRRIAELLSKSDPASPVTQELKRLLARLDTVPPPKPNRLQRWLRAADKQYEHFWRNRVSRRLVGILFVAQAAIFLIYTLGIFFDTFHHLDSIFRTGGSYGHKLVICQLVTSAVAGGFALAGAVRLPSSRLQAFELFRRAVLINLLLTEFFTFTRVQFHALPGFIANLLLLTAIHYAINEEHRAKAS